MARAKAMSAKKLDVKWIITEGNDPDDCANGEFGVAIDGVPYIYYKWPDPKPSPGVKFRVMEKREFGEVIRRPQENEDAEDDAAEAADDATWK